MKNRRKTKKFETVRTVLRSQENISTAPILSNLQKIITNSNKIQIEFCKRLTCLIFSILSNKNNSRNEITIIFHENFTNINQSSNNTQYNMIPSKTSNNRFKVQISCKQINYHGSEASCWKLFYQDLRSTHKYVY